jgi:hypothetical protein
MYVMHIYILLYVYVYIYVCVCVVGEYPGRSLEERLVSTGERPCSRSAKCAEATAAAGSAEGE